MNITIAAHMFFAKNICVFGLTLYLKATFLRDSLAKATWNNWAEIYQHTPVEKLTIANCEDQDQKLQIVVSASAFCNLPLYW